MGISGLCRFNCALNTAGTGCFWIKSLILCLLIKWRHWCTDVFSFLEIYLLGLHLFDGISGHKCVYFVFECIVFNNHGFTFISRYYCPFFRMCFFYFEQKPPVGQGIHIRKVSRSHTTPLDKWWVRRRDLYLTTHNTHDRHTSIHPDTQDRQTTMYPVGFEPTITAGERPQTYPLDFAATGTGNFSFRYLKTYNCR